MGRAVGYRQGARSRIEGGGAIRIDSQSEKSGWGGAGGALAMAAAMTASISAEVGGLEGEYDLLYDAASSCREMSQAQRSFGSIAARFFTLEPQWRGERVEEWRSRIEEHGEGGTGRGVYVLGEYERRESRRVFDGRKMPEREWEWDAFGVESGVESWGMVQP